MVGYRTIPKRGPRHLPSGDDTMDICVDTDRYLAPVNYRPYPATSKMLAPASESAQSASTAPSEQKTTRGRSCVLCQRRKVKCDRQKPCSNCIKGGADCIPSAPAAPRRPRRTYTDQSLAARLRRYEYLLRKNRIKFENDDDVEDSLEESLGPHVEPALSLGPPRIQERDKGLLLADHQNSRYVENPFWESLRDQLQDSSPALGISSDEETDETNLFPDAGVLFLGHEIGSKDLASLHPPPVQIFRLWQTFLLNINPMVKSFHAPTVQQIILEASADVSNIPRAIEALMFAVYLLAVTSLRNDECETKLGQPRSMLLSKYSHGAQQALVNAKFLRSFNLYTLQAYILFLHAMRREYDPDTYLILTGAGVRIAQRLGLHRDGPERGIPPFDAEIRRRTWWQIIVLDGQATKLAGAAWTMKIDTRLPLNISDSDLSPCMKEVPLEKEGATEMIFCCLQYEVLEACRRSAEADRPKDGKCGSDLITAKDKAIDALEARLQNKYIKYCDPSIPLNLLTIYISQSVTCTMRLMAHHPRQYPDKGASMPQEEKDMLFALSLRELSIAAALYSNELIRGFRWHIHTYFQYPAFIYALSELRIRTKGQQVDRAWEQVQTVFDYRPGLLDGMNIGLFYAIGTLALEAWAKREEALCLSHGLSPQTPPRFISELRSQRRIPASAPSQSSTGWRTSETTASSTEFGSTLDDNLVLRCNRYAATALWRSNDLGYGTVVTDPTPDDWEYWQTLMNDNLPTFAGDGV